eukprot:COSAG02_NODE_4651_length_5132_cov_7.294854_4_plen_114_part_00
MLSGVDLDLEACEHHDDTVLECASARRDDAQSPDRCGTVVDVVRAHHLRNVNGRCLCTNPSAAQNILHRRVNYATGMLWTATPRANEISVGRLSNSLIIGQTQPLKACETDPQ